MKREEKEDQWARITEIVQDISYKIHSHKYFCKNWSANLRTIVFHICWFLLWFDLFDPVSPSKI